MRTKPTAADVCAYRDEHECSLFEAVDAVNKQWRRDYIEFLRAKVGEVNSIADCRDTMSCIIDLMQILVERGQ